VAAVSERRRASTDLVLFNAVVALLVIGIVMVYDSSYARSMEVKVSGFDGFYFLKRQAIYAGIGVVAMLAMVRYGYWKLRALAVPLLILSCVLLLMVWAPGIGLTRNGAARWIGKGMLQFQPSELAKLALLIYLAALLARLLDGKRFDIRSFQDGLLAPLMVVGLIVVLVEREPDLGTAAVIGLTSITLFFLAGARLRHIAGIMGAGVVFVILVTMLHGFRGDRLKTFMNPEADYYGRGYQISHGLMAVGSGGLKGVGIGAGREKFYLPEANTDFIFATVAEETGLWGSVLVLTLLMVVGWRAVIIAHRAPDTFGRLLAGGIGAMITWQALINIAVVTGSMPATGVPLPFVSYGGTSLVFLLISVGILLNIAQHADIPKMAAVRKPADKTANVA
jgi:cell division protein FtsW